MARFEIKHNILFFPDKEKIELTAERVIIETEKVYFKHNKETGEKEFYKYNQDAKLRVRIRWNKNVLNFNVGYRVYLSKWNTETQRCTAGTTHGKTKVSAKEINSEIQTIEDVMDSIFTAFELKNKIPSVNEFRGEYHKQTNSSKAKTPDSEKTFFMLFDEFVSKESQANNWKYATLQKWATVKNHLKDYDAKLSFDKLTKDGLNDYIYYLRDKKDLRNSSILKQIGFLKWMLKWATGEGYNTNLAYSNFFPKLDTIEKKVIFLTWDELMHVYNFDWSTAQKKVITGDVEQLVDLTEENKRALEKVRDVFCFMSFTSLRYSDVENLRKSDISSNQITITTVKTSDSLRIDLNNYSKAILEKYKDQVFPDNKALPVISNQKMNDHLKEMGEICGLDTQITITYFKGAGRIDEVYPKYELLSTHAGRRTFICNALALGIAPQVVMKFTGHASYSSMKPYIDIADDEKRNAMDLFNVR